MDKETKMLLKIISITCMILIGCLLYNYQETFVIYLLLILSFVGLYFTFKIWRKSKDIVLDVGRKWLDFVTASDIIFSIIIPIVGFCLSPKYEYGEISYTFWWWLLGGIGFFLVTIIKNYVIYLLVDIRDSLKLIAENITKKD